jgi:hypothetical protein
VPLAFLGLTFLVIIFWVPIFYQVIVSLVLLSWVLPFLGLIVSWVIILVQVGELLVALNLK